MTHFSYEGVSNLWSAMEFPISGIFDKNFDFFISMTLHNIGKATGIIESYQKIWTVLLNKVVSGRLFPNGHYIALLHKLWKIPAKNFM